MSFKRNLWYVVGFLSCIFTSTMLIQYRERCLRWIHLKELHAVRNKRIYGFDRHLLEELGALAIGSDEHMCLLIFFTHFKISFNVEK